MASIPEYQTPVGAKKPGAMDRFLTTIERVGNKVPHPGIIFFILIGIVIVLSAVFGLLGTSITYQVADPITGEI